MQLATLAPGTAAHISVCCSGCCLVAAGKSSVLQAILGKMMAAQGSVQVGGSIAYVPQTPWVQNLTLRENILFGLEFDEAKYNAVIHAAALELDLKILPKGECSEGGVTPSDSVAQNSVPAAPRTMFGGPLPCYGWLVVYHVQLQPAAAMHIPCGCMDTHTSPC